MKKFMCDVCGYVYDPEVGDEEHGIAPGTPFEKLPEDWVCPPCSVSKEHFSPVVEHETSDNDMYICEVCGYVYEPKLGDKEHGIAPGTPFSEIPEDWVCPPCGAGKYHFKKIEF